MGRSIRINYRWRLFIPTAALVWVLIIGMGVWQYLKEKEYRSDSVNEQLDLVSSRIIAFYETGKEPKSFINFISGYYRAHPLFDKIKISVYLDENLVASTEEAIVLRDNEKFEKSGRETPEEYEVRFNNGRSDDSFYYKVKFSPDRRLLVYTVLPYDKDVTQALLPDTDIWIVIIMLAMGVTILLYLSTKYFSKSVSMLKNFADSAATDPNFLPNQNFPHDELGDVSRQITHLYNERTKAMIRLKREHRVALHAMEEKARLKRQLTNNVNHELKTPIGVIKGYIDTIIENPDMSESSKMHFLSKAREHVDRLVNLITDISAITRLEEASGLIHTERINFHDVVYNAANDLEESKVLGNMEFIYNLPPEIEVMGNYSLLTGMLINLAKNAATYSKGTECGVILTGEDKKFYKFGFYDNGVGVGEEHLPFLFERFYRVDTGRARKSGGTGLGLPIVYNTIVAHGGEISVENRHGGGLQFNFTLPKATD